jgi:hypothetical protein
MRRRSFALMETLIALSLAVLVMVACLSLFVALRKTSAYQQAALERDGLRWRRSSTLRWILSHVQREKQDPFVLEDTGGPDQRLLFVFDHGTHIDPQLANEDLAQLYLDPQRGLVLVTRSHQKRRMMGQEKEETSVVWPGAKKITWRFALKPKDKKDKPGVEDCLKDGWATEWRSDWGDLPAIVQATIEDEDSDQNVVTAIVVHDIEGIKLK